MKNIMKDFFLKLIFNNMKNYMRSSGAQRQKMCREKEAQIFRKKRSISQQEEKGSGECGGTGKDAERH